MQWLEKFLKRKRWRKVIERDTRPREWGAGEVDLLVWDEPRQMLWVIEIKEHRLATLGSRPLLEEPQRRRLQRSRAYYRSLYPYPVGLGLLWRDPDSERLEFLENP